MLPYGARLDARNDRLGHSIPCGNRSVRSFIGANSLHLFRIKFRVRRTLTSGHCAVLPFIHVVFRASGPTEIVRSVIQTVAVAVGDLMRRAWWFSVENAAHNPVGVGASVFAIVLHQDNNVVIAIPPTKTGLEQAGRAELGAAHLSHDPAVRTDGVIRRPRYRFPYFFAKRVLSHSVTPHVRVRAERCSNSVAARFYTRLRPKRKPTHSLGRVFACAQSGEQPCYQVGKPTSPQASP